MRIADGVASSGHIDALSRLGVEFFGDLSDLDLSELRVKPSIDVKTVTEWIVHALESRERNIEAGTSVDVASDFENAVAPVIDSLTTERAVSLRSILATQTGDFAHLVDTNKLLNDVVALWDECTSTLSRVEQIAAASRFIWKMSYSEIGPTVGLSKPRVYALIQNLSVAIQKEVPHPWSQIGWQHDLAFMPDRLAKELAIQITRALMTMLKITVKDNFWIEYAQRGIATTTDIRTLFTRAKLHDGYAAPKLLSVHGLGVNLFAVGWNATLSGPVLATNGGAHTVDHIAALAWADRVVHTQNGFAAGIIVLRRSLSKEVLLKRIALACASGIYFPMPIVLILEQDRRPAALVDNHWSGLWLMDLLAELPGPNHVRDDPKAVSPVQEVWHMYEPAFTKAIGEVHRGVFPEAHALGEMGVWAIARNCGRLNLWQ